MRVPAGGQSGSAPKALRWRHLTRRDARKPLTITVKLRGGPEAWVEIHARGSAGRYPGASAIADILRDINGGL